MSSLPTLFHGGPIFDGQGLLHDHAVVLEKDVITYLGPARDAPKGGLGIDLQGDILAPGFVDLQVNGGDGVMFNDAPTTDTLARMARAHARLGCAAILPTLITDAPDKTRAAIEAAIDAAGAGMRGIAGLHLEGPHLSVARKGAHSADLIRPMTDDDLALLEGAARALPALMITLAPENVTPAQVSALVEAGATVSLGHSDADYVTCMAFADAGAACVTHLFNAMSQLGNREPGLVGAALQNGQLSAGLIADGIHVHPASIRAAWDAKRRPGGIFLVSDAMACAGSDIQSFQIDGRKVTRSDGRLTLEDGTLAGADLDLPTAVRFLVNEVGIGLEPALRAATSGPARVIGRGNDLGCLVTGLAVRPIRLTPDLHLAALAENALSPQSA